MVGSDWRQDRTLEPGNWQADAATRTCDRVRWLLAAMLVCFLLVLFTVVAVKSTNGQFPAGKDWSLYGGDWGNTRFSTLAQINTTNVKSLQGAWVSKRFENGASSRSVPVVMDGMMFLTAGGRVYALNAKNGETIWSYLSETRVPHGPYGIQGSGLLLPSNKGVAVAEGLVFVGLADGHVIALNEKTGELAWTRQVGDEQGKKGQAVAGAPTYADGTLFVGMANGDFGLRGRVAALEAKSGREMWHFFTIPGPGEAGHDSWPRDNDVWKLGGGGVWLNGTVDPDLGMVYFSTGNTVPQTGGEIRAGDNLFTSSIVALDSKTGALRWYFQAVHHDIWDADIPMAPVLYDAQVDGGVRRALAAMRGDGYLFLLDRKTGKPLIPVEERPVPQYPRVKTAAKQPFPVGAESLTGVCADWEDKIPHGWVLTCNPFTPHTFETKNVLAPAFGVRATPMSYSPQTGYIYAQGTLSLAGRWRVSNDPWFFVGNGDAPISAPMRRSFVGAIDTRTDKIAWRKEVPTAFLGLSGVMTTAGGLLFRGSGNGIVEAYDAKTGELLWQFQVGGTVGPASSYEVDGEQYVAVPAGSVVWSFKLGGTILPLHASEAIGGEAPPPELIDEIETATLRHSSVTGNRYVVDEYSFNPSRARVPVGTRVVWLNNGTIAHTIVAQDGSWSTGPLKPAETGGVTFDRPGTYTYICKEHPWSYGQILVVAENGGGASGVQ